MAENTQQPDWSEYVTIPLKGGNNIYIRREDNGSVTFCNDTACLNIPATAPMTLGLLEFFQSLNDEPED